MPEVPEEIWLVRADGWRRQLNPSHNAGFFNQRRPLPMFVAELGRESDSPRVYKLHTQNEYVEIEDMQMVSTL
jgi:hypothetical protein